MGKPTKNTAEEPRKGLLLAWRERMGFSQRDACEALGCSRGAYGKWEADEEAMPQYIGLACAALALGIKGNGLQGVMP